MLMCWTTWGIWGSRIQRDEWSVASETEQRSGRTRSVRSAAQAHRIVSSFPSMESMT